MTNLRQALAQEEKPPVKSYCGGKANYCTPEVTPEVTGDVDAVNISAERVDETAKGEHKPYGYVWTSLRDGMEVRFSRMPPNKFYNPQDIKPVYTAPPKREWVGLTEEEMEDLLATIPWPQVCRAIEARLKEKNT